MRSSAITNLALVMLILFQGCGRKTAHDGHKQHRGRDIRQQLANFVEPTTKKVISSQKVVKPRQKRHSILFEGYGFIVQDERRSTQVATRIGGRIEKTHVRYDNQYVRKGEKILDLYSPDLNTFQEELLFTRKADPDGETPKHAAHKLKLLGMTDRQIQTILETGKTTSTVSIYSPHNGYIFYSASNAAPSGASPSMPQVLSGDGMEMGASAAPKAPAQAMPQGQGLAREGAYISAGQTLFWINDMHKVWGILSFDNLSPGAIAVNDSIIVMSELLPDSPIKTVVQFIEPQYEPGQKFVQVRVYLPNPKKLLRVNSLLTGTLRSRSVNTLTLPASAVLQLGTRRAVWKKVDETEQGSHIFEIHYVTVGPVSQGEVAVLHGLSEDDEVALDAGYLVDRESLIQTE